MKQNIYREAERFVVDSFNKINKSYQIPHFLRTVYWLKILKPDADEALLVAAVAHDIERAYRKKDLLEKKISAGFTNIDFYRPHEERGAKIIADFLQKQGADGNFVKRVEMLVLRHEEGGNDDQDLLKDADSISFFENNVSLFLEKKVMEIGKEKVKQKFDWMFERISSEKARNIAEPLYKKAVKDLGLTK